MQSSSLGWVIALCTVLAHSSLAADSLTDAQREFFETRVRPALAENCHECHGPEKQKAGLRLDHISTILVETSRGTIVRPGDPQNSVLVDAINYGNVDLQMPPTGKLSDGEIATLTTWVEMGAPWPDEPKPSDQPVVEDFDLEKRKNEHWAWRPIQKPGVPDIVEESWSRHPVDRFLLARLEEAGLNPSEPAKKRTLLRRVYFDLIGLPPKPEEVEAFLDDSSPDAFERVVDRLLASPHFGERWGRHWLDLVRFAETYGHEQDYPIREAWRYRDYVIRALNADVPYDQFVKEHIAGDLMESPRRHPEEDYNESIIGTGFWFMHQATHGPVDVAQDEADRIDNQIDVMTKAFLGMTVSCARCHDHKFDAISTEDYYSLTAFLRSSRQQFALLDPGREIGEKRRHLEELKAEGQPVFEDVLRDIAATGAHEIADYLLAANEAVHGSWKESDGVGTLKPDISFDGFERGAYDKWFVEGDAFNDKPATGSFEKQGHVGGFKGRYLANSYGDGNHRRGKLVSRPFVIERPYIQFLVGGGADGEKTVVRLLVGGGVVRTVSGQNDEVLRPHLWDVREFQGQIGRIEIYDAAQAEWGHIMADGFVFTEYAFPVSVQRPLETVAIEFGVHADRLGQWILALEGPDVEGTSHPLNAWHELTDKTRRWNTEAFANRRGDFSERVADVRKRAREREDDFVLFEDFEDGFDHWFAEGEAFGDEPARGEWYPASQPLQVSVPGVAHSGLISDKLEGVLRSPTFTITHDNLHYRVAGRGGRVRLVIGRYQLREFNGLLFEQTLFDVHSGDEFRWETQTRSISKFKGQKAYIELIDRGDGFIAVDEIRFSNGPAPEEGAHRIADALSESEPDSMDALAEFYAARTREALNAAADGDVSSDQATLLRWLFANELLTGGDAREELIRVAAAMAEIERDVPNPMPVLAMTDGTPEETRVFVRGNHNNPGAPVEPRLLVALDEGAPLDAESRSDRLALAEKIVYPDNPLTARVMVNRIWHYLFGRGIVASPDNFGVLGRRPTHPELLDYLAQRFVDQGWSIKGMIRFLLTSRAYQMTSAITHPEAEEVDPANELLHRARVRRLEGEVIRDSVLAVAGTLDETMYGPSVPIYLSPFMGGHRRPPRSGPMDGDNRRSIYIEVRRNYLSPMMLAFDTPIPDSTKGRRTESNIPAQALILMNDPFVVDQAKTWSEKVLQDFGTASERIDRLYREAFARPPTGAETSKAIAFLRGQADLYELDPKSGLDDSRLWADFCHVLFTLKEFIFIG